MPVFFLIYKTKWCRSPQHFGCQFFFPKIQDQMMPEPSKFWMPVFFPYIQDQVMPEPSKFWMPVFSLYTRPSDAGALNILDASCFSLYKRPNDAGLSLTPYLWGLPAPVHAVFSDHELSKRTLLELVWACEDFPHLYMLCFQTTSWVREHCWSWCGPVKTSRTCTCCVFRPRVE